MGAVTVTVVVATGVNATRPGRLAVKVITPGAPGVRVTVAVYRPFASLVTRSGCGVQRGGVQVIDTVLVGTVTAPVTSKGVVVAALYATTFGVTAIEFVAGGAAAAMPALASAPAAGMTAASGAAASIGRLLSSSAAVAAYAVKLLRSEYKVPSSSER